MRTLVAIVLVAAALAITGCGEFEKRSIVLDLRILNVRTVPPEIVSPFDPNDPTNVQLAPVQVCAFVADPHESRSLTWGMAACAPTDSDRCDDLARPFVDMGTGTVEDPEEADQPVEMCAELPAGGLVPIVLEDAVSLDSLAGFGGIALQVEFWVRDSSATIAEAEFAKKRVVYAPELPAGRTPNQNPTVGSFMVTRQDSGANEVMPMGRCLDQTEPLRVVAGESITIYPSEPAGIREDYALPTYDGGEVRFTENMRYAWYSTYGNWGRETSGGPTDVIGNEPVRHTTWTAPRDPEVVGDGLDVMMWFVQRDERAGSSHYYSCVHVEPALETP